MIQKMFERYRQRCRPQQAAPAASAYFINVIFHLSLAFTFCLIILSCSKKDNYQELNVDIIAPSQDYLKITEGEKLYFKAAVSGGVPPYAYHWDFGVVAPPSSDKYPEEIVFNWQGAYKVLLTIKDAKNNTNTDFVRIIVEEEKYSVKTKSAF